MKDKVKIRSPYDCISLLMKYTRYHQEHFGIIALDGGRNVIAVKTMFVGSSTDAWVSVREIFWELCRKRATSFICFHNHPSGNEEPSLDDIETTKKLKEVSEIIGIQLLDHIIVTKYCYFSFTENDSDYRIFLRNESAVAERR